MNSYVAPETYEILVAKDWKNVITTVWALHKKMPAKFMFWCQKFWKSWKPENKIWKGKNMVIAKFWEQHYWL